jgi:hypothetical protein
MRENEVAITIDMLANLRIKITKTHAILLEIYNSDASKDVIEYVKQDIARDKYQRKLRNEQEEYDYLLMKYNEQNN